MTEITNRRRGQKREGYKKNDPRFIEYYEEKFPTKTNEERLKLKSQYNRSCNYQCIEYYQRLYPTLSLEECERLRESALLKSKSNRPNNIEYYEKHFPDATHEEHLEMLHNYSIKNNFMCVEYYQNRFPDKTRQEHVEMLQKNMLKYQNNRPDNSGIKNPAHRSKTTEQQRKERSVFCLEYWRKKYPEKTEAELIAMRDAKQRDILIRSKLTPNNTQLQYWLDRSTDVNEAKKKLKERQTTFSLKKCLEKYGEADGYEIFNSRQSKWQKSLHKTYVISGKGITQSRWANENIKFIKKYIPDAIEELNIGKYSFDLAYRNKIIEFNGDFWHCNPKIYDKDYINKTNGKSAQDIWLFDKNKTDLAIKNGYTVLTVWESEYNQDPIGTIRNCINFLNEE